MMNLRNSVLVRRYKNFRNPSNVKTVVGVLVALLTFCVTLWLPSEVYGLPGLTLVEQRMVAIFLTAAILWMTEAVPTWCTSVLIIAVMLLTVSDSSLWLFRSAGAGQELGVLLSYKAILACFADPVIILFLGGFVLAIGVSKTGLDVFMAKALLYPFGTRTPMVLLGFIVVTAIFSAFISNTATAAMMLAFLGPVLKALPANGKGRIALAMAIPLGANIGGIATPIGTPPNGIALKYLNDPAGLNMNIGFGDWVVMMLPLTLVTLFIGWVVLLWLFPFKEKHLHLSINGGLKKGYKTWTVAVTFVVTVLVWFTGHFNGVDANAAALIPITMLCLTGILSKQDLERINWSVLWMVAGGFALGLGFNKSGLAQDLVQAIPFGSWSPMAVLIGSGLICWVLSNFISNTATAALLVPILCAVGTGMGDTLAEVGGVKTLLVGVAMSASMAMTLPISTPPNALAHSTGFISQYDMARAGLIIGILGGVVGYLMLIYWM
jgi:sodium-dependent dicarboxylate transporter 2/3/5